MSTALQGRPAKPATRHAAGHGGAPARRAVVRWAWRLFRREWRQQLLVLTLLTVAVAATTAGLAVATNAVQAAETTVTLPGSDPQLSADLAAFQRTFGPVAAVAHQKVAVAGTASSVDVRAEVLTPSAGGRATPSWRIIAGRAANGPTEVAMTPSVAAIFNLRIGDIWTVGGRAWRLVGLVENPDNLREGFALVAPGQADPPVTVTILLHTDRRLDPFRLPSGLPLIVESASAARTAAAVVVLALATVGLLFVGLVAVAGFTVMAQRRRRAMGMLGALGATDRHVRLVMLANGAVVGAVAALSGAAVGVLGWIAFAPRLETIAAHRISRFNLPWWAIAMAVVLAVATAIAAAWWPARKTARISVVAALSGRPPRPQPAHRFAALGGAFMVVGLGLLAFAHQRRPALIITGIVATTLGMLFLAPLTIRGPAAAAGRLPISVRLALRDLARHQARSGAALGAVSLAVGIAATIAVVAASAAAADATTRANLPANQLIIYLSPGGGGSPIPQQDPAALQSLQGRVDNLARVLGSRDVLALDAATNPAAPDLPGPGNGPGGKEAASLVQVTKAGRGFEWRFVSRLYVATPALLAHYGIAPSQINPGTDVLTSSAGRSGLEVASGDRQTLRPKFQTVNLPNDTSAPNALITTHAFESLGLQLLPAGWLIQTPGPLTAAQINTARQSAAGAGLTIETRSSQQSLAQLRLWATAVGVLMALGVLAVTVGLIRSETSHDLRVLAAAGATSTTRRTLTGATAGALGLLGAVLGTAGGYLALAAWYRSDLTALDHPPVVNLVVIIAGLPLVAAGAGWLLAGREPPAISRQPLD